MVQINEIAAAGPEKRSGAVKLRRRLTKLAGTALDSLEDVLTDEGAKAADRISAVKLTFELLNRQTAPKDEGSDGVLRVVFDGIEKELAE